MKTINITLCKDVNDVTAVTHPAPHHADETMAMAILALRYGSVKVLRTRNQQQIDEAASHGAIICDVGSIYDPELGYFDHHQRDFTKARADGTKYSSAGLLWKEYGAQICAWLAGCTAAQAATVASKVDKALIRGIDAIDNGQLDPGEAMTVSQAIAALNTTWDEPANDEVFIDACQMAYTVLTSTIKFTAAAVKGRDIVEEAIAVSADGIMLLPTFVGGWVEIVLDSENPKADDILYAVFRNLQGQWNVQALPPKDQPRGQRKPLPEIWRGLSVTDLRATTGVADAVFCHVAGFICGASSQQGALELARLAVKA